MLWATLVLIIICGISDAKEIGNSCNGTEGCTKDLTEGISCIEQYNDLEMYVMNNKTLVEKLSRTFFTSQTATFITGRGASQFVKITYNFQTSSDKHSIKGNVTNCSAQQSTFIWSEAVLYLVGPEALYWCTLFAVNIDEVDVTIELPCLCSDVYDDLLSRLTYLIKVYAANKYHDHPLQFANPYYIQMKSTTIDESGTAILGLMIAVIITFLLAITPLTILHIFPIVVTLITKNEELRDYQQGKYKYKTLIHWTPLTCTGILTCIGFSVIHNISVIRFKQYGEEVLSSENHIQIMLIIYNILSPATFYIGFILSAIILAKRVKEKKREGNKEWLLMLTAAVISMNFIYIACYFFPFMLWAFIHHPFLTIFTHVMLVLLVICVYLIFLGAWRLFKLSKKYEKDGKVSKFMNTILYSCMAWGIALSVTIFLAVSKYIITLGRFGDFEELNSLAPSLLIAVLGLFLLKPVYNHVTDKIKDDKKPNQGDDNGESPLTPEVDVVPNGLNYVSDKV